MRHPTGRHCHAAAVMMLGVLCVVALAWCANVPADQRTQFGRLCVARVGAAQQASPVPWSRTDEPFSLAGQALVDLYTATNGPKWSGNTNWLDGDPCNQHWYGVICVSSTISGLYVRHQQKHTTHPTTLTHSILDDSMIQ